MHATPDYRRRTLAALAALLVLAAIGVAGPTGLLAWGENRAALAQRKAEVERLSARRDALKNRVELLDPRAADSDLAGELVRERLGVMHEDEVVVTLTED